MSVIESGSLFRASVIWKFGCMMILSHERHLFFHIQKQADMMTHTGSLTIRSLIPCCDVSQLRRSYLSSVRAHSNWCITRTMPASRPLVDHHLYLFVAAGRTKNPAADTNEANTIEPRDSVDLRNYPTTCATLG